jgi:enoyl-CoA hydratase
MSEDALTWAPASGQGPEVRYALDGPLGRARLERPGAINALNGPMVESLRAQLMAWAQDDAVAAVVLEGDGERGLCAGGDVRSLREHVLAGQEPEVVDFWRREYELNALIADYPTPFVARMDGIVMGGGIGLSAHGSLRLVSERTRLAMPETIIGFFPDVGALHLLARAPGETGTHLALTGTTVGGVEALTLGMADALVPTDRWPDVLDALRQDPGLDAAGVAEVVGDAAEDEPCWLEQHQGWIDECYAGDDAATILGRLRAHPAPEAREAAELIASRSPHSVAVTLEALRRAASLTVQQVLAQDLHLGAAFAGHPDFAEGVRAQLVDKDRSPRWQHASVEDVPREQVLAAFAG